MSNEKLIGALNEEVTAKIVNLFLCCEAGER